MACDLVAKGYRVALPFGEDCDYDLVVERGEQLERVQVKYASSKDGVIGIECRSRVLTNGKVMRTKHYTPETIDWLAVYNPDEDHGYYVPSTELGPVGRSRISLRLRPTRNGQRVGIRDAAAYQSLDRPTGRTASSGE